MKFIRPQKPRGTDRPFIFLVTPQEKKLLLDILQLSRVVNEIYQPLSRDPEATDKAAQEWLHETMVQQHKDHDKRLEQFITHHALFFKVCKDEIHLTLTGEQMEWMLRVLNSIRVASWVRLGRPELEAARRLGEKGRRPTYVSFLELTGYFESALLEAFA